MSRGLSCIAEPWRAQEMSALVLSTPLTLGDFLPGYVFDSCSGVCAPSHWPDSHHEANYSHRQLMFPSSGSRGNDSIMQGISVKSVTFGNRSLRRELGLHLHQLCPIKLLRHGRGDAKLHVSQKQRQQFFFLSLPNTIASG